ncbi:MAG: acetyl-CoA decarbonylase/synthase complex subunit delta [Acidobacteria bacterium]|nr:acetyl-CoA decarbonylase/synthase complex subunit delta [Acidobacteriota bacterium]
MGFEIPIEKNSGKIAEVTIGATSEQGGTRSNTITIGGSTALPFLFFEGEHPNRPALAMEVFDKVPAKYPEALLDYYRDVIDKPADMAKKCVEQYGAELISVRLDETHPEKGDRSADEAADVVRQVLDSVKVPLIITGHSHYEKINVVMKKVCEVTAGENCLINYVETDNYKTIAAACMAYNHSIVAQSPIDVNMAKQLNILLSDMNFPSEKIVIDPLTGALGYGLEYTYSIMERIRNDGLAGDSMLAFPMIINPGYESSRVKEVRVTEEEYPDWGDMELRSAYWETATAMSLLSAGSELIVMYHPKAMETVKKHVDELYSAESGN